MKSIHLKIKLITLSCFILIFTGCSQSAFTHFDKKDEFAKNVQYSKVLKVVDKDIVKGIATITYLNAADSDKWDNGKQNFIIGLYIADKNKECCHFHLSIQKEKTIQLNKTDIEYEEVDLLPVETKEISKEDPLYDTIPLRNGWAKHRLVSFDDKDFGDVQTFTVKFSEKNNSATQKSVTFTKE